MCRIPYDWRGDPELAQAMAGQADAHGTWITAIDDPCLPVHYATVNLWHYLGRGLGKRWISMSTAQTGDTEDFLRAGRALGAAIARDRRRGSFSRACDGPVLCAGSAHQEQMEPRSRVAVDPQRILSDRQPGSGFGEARRNNPDQGNRRALVAMGSIGFGVFHRTPQI